MRLQKDRLQRGNLDKRIHGLFLSIQPAAHQCAGLRKTRAMRGASPSLANANNATPD
jgi:hypothetical protein